MLLSWSTLRPALRRRRPGHPGAAALILLALALGGAAPAWAGRSFEPVQGTNLRLAFDESDLTWGPGEGGFRPLLPGTVPSGRPGYLDLPVRVIPVAPPPGQRLEAILLEAASWTPIEAPGPIAVLGGGGEPARDEVPFPRTLGVGQGGYLRGDRIDAVIVSPIRRVAGGRLELMRSGAARLLYAPDEAADVVAPLRGRRGLAGRDAPSPASTPREREGRESAVFDPRMRPSLDGSPVTMVIVTPEAMEGEFDRLAEWRTASGTPTVVRTLEWIRETYAEASDPAESVRLFLKDALRHWGLEAVLLAGDPDVVPMRYGRTTFFLGEDIPTELYYTCLDGTWNGNGNARFGEGRRDSTRLGDGVDLYPELWAGRLTPRDAAGARVLVDKILRYETDPPVDDDYPASALLLGEVLFPQNWDGASRITFDGAGLAQEVAGHLPGSFRTVRLYENYTAFTGALPETITTVIGELNRGYGLVNHVGHGYYNNMAVGLGGRSIFIPDVDGFTNGPRTSVLYAINCSTAGVDFDAIAEHWLANPNGGAVACVGSTRYDFPATSRVYDLEFFRLLFEEGITRLGEASGQAKVPFAGLSNADNAHRWTQFTLAYLGDPLMRIWSSRPAALVASHPATVVLNASPIPVTVTRDGVPVAGALVTVYRRDEVHASALTDAEGRALLAAAPRSTGSLSIVATAFDAIPWRGTIAVTANPGGYPIVAAVEADPTASATANGNGRFEAGESSVLRVRIRNGGAGALASAAVQVVPADPAFIVIAQPAGPGDIPAGGEAAFEFTMRAPPDAPDLEPVAIRMRVTAAGGEWDLPAVVPFGGPRLVAGDLEIHVVAGSDNGRLDPGDEITLVPRVHNRGTGGTRPLTARLALAPGETSTLLAGERAYGAIDAGAGGPGPGATPFRLRLGGGALPVMTFELHDDGGLRHAARLDLVPPDAPAGISAEGRPADIVVVWNPSTARDLQRYAVFRAEAADGLYERVSGPSPSPNAVFVDEPLPPLAVRFYRVAAQDSSGNLSGLSAAARGTTTLATREGFPLETAVGTTTSPLVVDLDGDGVLDMLTGGEQLYAFHADGSELRDGDHDARTLGVWSAVPEPSGIWAAPATADVDGDGRLDVAGITFVEGRLYLWDSAGNVLPGWPRSTGSPTGSYALGSPAFADLDGDGDLEIVVHSERALFAFDRFGGEVHDGDGNPATEGILVLTGSTASYASVAVQDLDGDGKDEIIAPTRSGKLHVVDGRGAPRPGFPIQFGSLDRPASLVSSPAVADLDGDGSFEILFGTGIDSLEVLRSDGTRFPGWPRSLLMNQDIMSSPAVADVDGDGALDVAVLSGNSTAYLWRRDGELFPGFPLQFADALGGSMAGRGSPAIANLDEDPDLEVAFANQEGWIFALNADATYVDGFPIKTGAAIEGGLLVSDVDRDGTNELCAVSLDRGIYLFGTRGTVTDAPGWPMFRHDPARSGSVRGRTDPGRVPTLHLALLQTPELPEIAAAYVVSTRELAGPPRVELDGGGLAVELLDAGMRLYRAQATLPAGTHVLTARGTAVDGVTGEAERSFDALDASPGAGWLESPAAGLRVRFGGGGTAPVLLAQRVDGSWTPPGAPPGPGPRFNLGHDGTAAPAGTEIELPLSGDRSAGRVEWWTGVAWRALPSVSGAGWVRGDVERFGWFRVGEGDGAAPAALTLLSAEPNPFAESTVLAFALPRGGAVVAEVFDLRGARVRTLVDAVLPAGEHRAAWDGTDATGRRAASGVYFLRVRHDGVERSRKLVRVEEGGVR